jgi:hypothetical protein
MNMPKFPATALPDAKTALAGIEVAKRDRKLVEVRK